MSLFNDRGPFDRGRRGRGVEDTCGERDQAPNQNIRALSILRTAAQNGRVLLCSPVNWDTQPRMEHKLIANTRSW